MKKPTYTVIRQFICSVGDGEMIDVLAQMNRSVFLEKWLPMHFGSGYNTMRHVVVVMYDIFTNTWATTLSYISGSSLLPRDYVDMCLVENGSVFLERWLPMHFHSGYNLTRGM